MDLLFFVLLVILACAKLMLVYGVIVVGAVLGGISSTIVFLFETWVFQAVFGAWVVFALQQLHQASTQRADRFQKRYDQKLAAIRSFFALLDKRIYATRAYRAALLSDDSPVAWSSERERYRNVVREWNEQAPGTIVTLLLLLPARLCFQLERETFQRFAAMDAYLGRIRRAREMGQVDRVLALQVTDLLTELTELSGASLAEFLNLAREEAKLIDQKPTIALENAPYLSLGYLVSSLFKPAIN